MLCESDTEGRAASPLGPDAFIVFHLLHPWCWCLLFKYIFVTPRLLCYVFMQVIDCMCMCLSHWLFPSCLLCRLGSEHCSASWQSQTRSQYPPEQGSVLAPQRLLASARWTPGTDPRPCPLDDMSPLGSACWTTQRSSLTSRWVMPARQGAFLDGNTNVGYGLFIIAQEPRSISRFHHSSSSRLVTGWHGNCMMLSCWMHGWNRGDLF